MNHKWQFQSRFRRRAFGWKSQPAVKRVREAVSEIRSVARKDKTLAAEGAVRFLERVSPALEQVDSSSGSIGTAVNNAITTLVKIIAEAPADEKTRDEWLERLWDAYQEDQMPYIELLGDYWGELCRTEETASKWADRLLPVCRSVFHESAGAFFCGTSNCLSALYAAGRHEEILDLLALKPNTIWPYREYGIKSTAALGRVDEAIQKAEGEQSINDSPYDIATVCEEVLLSAGRTEEAFERYAGLANRRSTYLAWYRAVSGKYPNKNPKEILQRLISETPGEEGKWFAAAKSAKLYEEALTLAQSTPCSPQTLTRAARDFLETKPEFALESGMAALSWLIRGYGYDITSVDVANAYRYTLNAAEKLDRKETTIERIKTILSTETGPDSFAAGILKSKIQIPSTLRSEFRVVRGSRK